MRLTKIKEVNDFLEIVNHCRGEVTLTSSYGDKYNLKSLLTQYVAIAALLGEHGDELELWCSDRNDEAEFLKFFHEHPEVMNIDFA